ncbi:MAG: response regulator [Vicinamibacteria bacterium]|nr:response regulator [Vicinamibacteria bacterium]
MAEIRALVVDNDERFMELLRSSLDPYGVRIDVASDANDCLDRVASLRLDVVFISVEAPDKSGFKLFSRVKGLSKVLPVVLVTSTVPPADMTLHQKLKIHADDYWNKSDLTPESVVNRMAKIVPLNERHRAEADATENEDFIVVEDAELDELLSDISRAERSMSEKAAKNSPPDAHQERLVAHVHSPVRGLSLDELEALVAELSDSSSAPASAAASPTTNRGADGSSEENAEILRLRNELDEARRIARASPFSQDFFRLLENVRDKEKEIFDLNVKLEARKRELSSRTGTARQLAEQLLGALRLREHEQEIISTMEDDLGAIRAELERERAERETLRLQQDAEIKRLEADFSLERERHAEACRRYETTITENRTRHADELRDEAQARLTTLEAIETRLREEKNHAVENAIERERRERDERIQELKRAHEEQLAAQEREHEAARKGASEELAQIHAALEKRLEEMRRERDARASQLADEHAQALLVKEQEHKNALASIERRLHDEGLREIEEIRRQHAAQLRDNETLHAQALAEAERRHQGVLAEIEKRTTREKNETIRASSSEWEGRLAQLRREHAQALAAREEEHERKRHDMQAQISVQLGHEREQTAELRRVVDEMSAARGRLERQLDETRDQLESKLAALEVRHAEALHEVEQNRLMDLQTAEKHLAEEKSRAIAAAEAGWRRKLEQAQHERDEAIEASRRDLEARMAAAEKSQRDLREREASEITAMRLELNRMQRESRETESRHAEALRLADKQRDDALRALEGRLNEKKTQALSALDNEWREKMEQERRRHAEALALLRQEHEAASSVQEMQLREMRERGGEEIRSLRAEAQDLRDKLSLIQAQQSEGHRQAEVERDAALQALEALLAEKQAQALAKTEEQWRQKLNAANREKTDLLMTVQREREQLDASAHQAQGEALEKKEGELKIVMAENARLEQQLTESKSVVANHERAIDSLRRESADQAQTIASLKAMIGDFTVAPAGPDQPIPKVAAAAKPNMPPPATPGATTPKPAGSSSPKVPQKTTSGSNRR